MSAALEALALTGLRHARDDMGWNDEARACAFAVGWLLRGGSDPKRAARAVAAVWAREFVTMGPV